MSMIDSSVMKKATKVVRSRYEVPRPHKCSSFFSDEGRSQVTRAARLSGVSMSQFIADAAMDAAAMVLRKKSA